MPHTILLSGSPQIPQERNAAEAITPGHLLQFVGSGSATAATTRQLRRHAVSGGQATPWFARERLTPDRGAATEAIDTPYASGETVSWLAGATGDQFYAWVASGAPSIVIGAALTSNGDGTLTLAGANTTIVAYAVESVNNSAGATPARLRVYAR